ncbi:glycerol-3-phosphate 1-O-acyltransferase PlsY [Gallalistipes aquisgranensis]|uniref:glycerol-3-phosphate 1-O-acyltransferase PlsY n=1 Tax=Gallalistipes aquisgranensis TaxID=2779358 RepID=UPI001CF8C045|nr:glycerol-3-phosphate 1-O-acyltransferase PlsY [Gallalistipes aquisgranensis]MBE5033785.1 glycerol-3-phosphate 1-O-acyltransferase PlsY [Gallalistipes aquisgranensis]
MVFVDILLVVAAYLLGSIPSAVWIGKKYYGVDVREHGSRNAGATNTLRVLGRRAALPVFALDVFKGFVAVTLAHLAGYPHGSDQTFNLKIALVAAAVLGHIFPVFAGFRGGKGVATLAGAVLGVYPPAVLLCVATFLVVLMVSHYVSLSSMTAGVMFPVYIVLVFRETYLPLILFGCVIAVLLIFTHRKNIRRLAAGTESKIYLWKPRPRK